MLETKQSKVMEFLYELGRIVGVTSGIPFQLLFFKSKIYHETKKKKGRFKGGKLIISNHYNLLDYVLGCFIVYPRKLNAVASELPYKSKITRFGMKFFGTVQANRESRSMRFIDQSVDLIKKGQLVQIYPEGRNTPDGNIHPFKHSYLAIAYRANCPIVPVITDGNYGVFKRARVIIGDEIDVMPFFTPGRRTPPREELERANEYVFAKVLELRERIEEEKKKEKGQK